MFLGLVVSARGIMDEMSMRGDVFVVFGRSKCYDNHHA